MLNKNGVSIILTTHYLHEAQEMCDRIGIINKGKFFNLKNSQFKNDTEPLVLECECFVCKKYSKAYLRHLLINESTSAWLYLTLHNIFQTENILSEVRKSILNSEFENYKESIING